jgi:hypothetical protein
MPGRGAARKPQSRTDHPICNCPQTPVDGPTVSVALLRGRAPADQARIADEAAIDSMPRCLAHGDGAAPGRPRDLFLPVPDRAPVVASSMA